MKIPNQENLCGIYKITNPKGKVYIGQSIDIRRRFRDYKYLKCIGQTKLYFSFNKYDINKHNFDIIHVCEQKQLNELETYYIELYNCFNTKHGLNLQIGGDVMKVSDESKMKMTKTRYGKKRTSNRKGMKLSEERKERNKLLRNINKIN